MPPRYVPPPPGPLFPRAAPAISSSRETQHGLTAAVRKTLFVPGRTAAQPYNIWHFQDPLFVIDSFDHLEREFVHWARARSLL